MLFLGFHNDREDARELTHRLRAVCTDEIWCSASEDTRRVAPTWPQDAIRAMREATGCVILLGELGINGALIDEVDRAISRRGRDRKFPIVPIALPSAQHGTDGRAILPDTLEIFPPIELEPDWRACDDTYFRGLARRLRLTLRPEPAPVLPPTTEPLARSAPSVSQEPRAQVARPSAEPTPAEQPPLVDAAASAKPTPPTRDESVRLAGAPLEVVRPHGSNPPDMFSQERLRRLWPVLALVVVATIVVVALRTGFPWTGDSQVAKTGGGVDPGSSASRDQSKDLRGGGDTDKKSSTLLTMASIPAGNFQMGSPDGDGNSAERPQHRVDLSAFLLASTEVTRAQYLTVMSNSSPPAEWSEAPVGDDLPANYILFADAARFCNALSAREGFPEAYRIEGETVTRVPRSTGYRLPSEAEWECACRAGTKTRYWKGDAEEDLAAVGWYFGNSEFKLHPVGEKPANSLGLYDMHGNVLEWCQDSWRDSYEGAPVDGSAWVDEDSEIRVIRGGSFQGDAGLVRSAYRDWGPPRLRWNGVGFRPARFVTP